ncbi:uncharacterized protein BT62DRAFT_1001932 [Guyanagaster necrorhizus]|uniref:Uncharacterized protein n=1 Tax=Guyanagaster necrorhizus TaxID=856835 RepID=A0A9P8AVJ9_9AGAR|nr:uncharacterized protein BT62DRAFT_1001932 [Guyanagaster necrorhizus MCA 3950]KAG7449644.1 hypothetical protein BT62DRAFT_1001932 [Guyanagaster necrorhizus MCA 3950]
MHHSSRYYQHRPSHQSRPQTRPRPKHKIFPLLSLPMELILEIITYAASPVFFNEKDVSIVKPSYSAAIAMACVSYFMYQQTMPHLLHTVILNSEDDLALFARTVRLHHQGRVFKRLSFAPLPVRRFWCSESYEALVDRNNNVDYSSLYQVICHAKSIGLPVHGMHLLYNGVTSDGANPSQDWRCRRVTFEGQSLRWKPITSSGEGATFLGKITHLSMWVPYHDLSKVPPEEYPFANWVQNIPFHMMPNLRHFSFPLLVDQRRYGSKVGYSMMLVYCAPHGQEFNPVAFRDWARSPKFWTYGWQVKLQITPKIVPSAREDWVVGYVLDEAERVWKEVDKMLKVKH